MIIIVVITLFISYDIVFDYNRNDVIKVYDTVTLRQYLILIKSHGYDYVHSYDLFAVTR